MEKHAGAANRKRAAVCLSVFLVALAAMAGQLGNLTLRQQQEYMARAETQSTRVLPVPAPRGIILDRDRQPLATNRPGYRLLVTYPHYDNPEVVERLARILGLSEEEIRSRADGQRDRPFEPVRLVDDLTPEQYAVIQERKAELPGVQVQEVPVRRYPQGGLAGHLLGYVGAVDQQDGDLAGKSGLEAAYESDLQGQPGLERIAVNSAAEPLGTAAATAPRPGQNLVLTIDSRLQRSAERALDWQMQRLQTIPNPGDGHAYPNAKAGAAVVIDVRTGAVLAMASRPGFDPNLFVGGISEANWRGLGDNPFQPLLNRAVQATYHPGSTWKMLTGAAALTTGVTVPGERVFSGAVYEPTGQKDWLPGGHGWVNLVDALRLSSDIYFYEMGLRVGVERQVEFARSFGFGAPTGIDLPDEEAGFLPGAEYREKEGWWLGQTASAAIGQILTVTPVQLAQYTAALANGGRLMKPYLVETVQDARGEITRKTAPTQTGTLPIAPDTLRTVVEGMKRVNLPGGTSDFATWPLPGIATAGKTGTAENPPQDDYGLFVGFAPAENPEIAVAVVIEQAGHGGSVSPVARSIFADYFGVTLPAADPARVPDDFAAKG